MSRSLTSKLVKNQQSKEKERIGHVEVFKVRINYKSGIQEEFWCSEFKIDTNGNCSWKPLFGCERPLVLNMINVESVYQVALEYIPKKELIQYEIDIDFEND